MSPFALEIDDCPVFHSLFQVFKPKCDRFVPAQTTGNDYHPTALISASEEPGSPHLPAALSSKF
jgi:hypothetical protein